MMSNTEPSALQRSWDWLLERLGTSVFENPLCFLPVVVAVICVTGIFYSVLDCVIYKKVAAGRVVKDGLRVVVPYIAAAVALSLLQAKLQFWTVPVPKSAPGLFEAAGQVLVFMAVGELLTYWWHRLEHGSRFVFRHVHYLHHRVQSPLTVWTNFVVHPVEGLAVMLCLYVPPLLFGAHPLVMMLYAAANTTAMVVTHSGYDFRLYPTWLLPAASGHALHHIEKRPTNLSVVMAYGDRLFGTYKAPR